MGHDDINTGFAWTVGDPVLTPGPEGSFDEVAVKDPSIVFHDGAWHLFYTARSEKEYTTAYVSAAELSGLHKAPRHELPMIRGKTRYGCAPQVFFFEPQNKWYLIYQSRDAGYQPMFSTTTDIPTGSLPTAPVGSEFPETAGCVARGSVCGRLRKWHLLQRIAPGANINYTSGHAIFEATHGTAPKYAGQDKVNPGSVILSGALML